ncbi:TPA: macro domain-containing protein [Salmonella enterica subsp. enterica serovar Birkenhead]
MHRAAGPGLLAECRNHIRSHGSLPAGEVILTPPGKLPCRGVIHEVGPRWLFGAYAKRQDGLLAQAYFRSLKLARDNGFCSTAFPCISTGHYFYPHKRVAGITLWTIITYLVNTPDMDVYCFCFSRRDLLIYRRIQEESHHSFLTDDA